MTAQPELFFYHRLARELGMTVSRLLEECDSREITSWIAWFLIADGKWKPKSAAGMAERFKAMMAGQSAKDRAQGKTEPKKGRKK